jgi:predicted ATPase
MLSLSPRSTAVEEPESHLHPDAQRALAEHLCGIAAAPEPPALVLETHSNALVLAVQLAVARGDIPPERVCAYWIDADADGTSVAKPAEFDRRGNPDGNWPPNTFADERELARELVACQLEE